jgi:hypothetical protein
MQMLDFKQNNPQSCSKARKIYNTNVSALKESGLKGVQLIRVFGLSVIIMVLC